MTRPILYMSAEYNTIEDQIYLIYWTPFVNPNHISISGRIKPQKRLENILALNGILALLKTKPFDIEVFLPLPEKQSSKMQERYQPAREAIEKLSESLAEDFNSSHITFSTLLT